MADISIIGFISRIRFTDKNVVVTVIENRNGYKRTDDTYMKPLVMSWQVNYKQYFKKYISGNFHTGAYVQVKGEVLPFAFGKEDGYEDGYTILGQTLNLASFPKDTRREHRIQKESLENAIGSPDLEEYLKSDF